MHDTVRKLGFLQMDPISTVATPQELVLWSRHGPYDRSELDRLLWEEKKLFEWQAFIYPIEDLPLIRARMREPWHTMTSALVSIVAAHPRLGRSSRGRLARFLRASSREYAVSARSG